MEVNEMRITTHVEQDDIPVQGNLIASGDEAFDKQCEDEALTRLAKGDEWAWASVEVRAQVGEFIGRDTLGGCSFKDFNEFKTSGIWSEMVSNAIEDLKKNMRRAIETGALAGRLIMQVDRLPRKEE
jgi:hypothetical protein